MNTAELFQKLRDVIGTQDFVSRHKISEKSFTRKRILPFHTTLAIILNGVRDSTTAEMDKFAQFFKTAEPTKSAFSQSRHKIKASAYVELNDMLIHEFYKSIFKIMHHKRPFFNNLTLLAIDGYDLQLPASEKVKDHFGCATNGSGKKMPMSTASELYDLENKLTICALNNSYKTGEGSMALELVKDFLRKDLNKDQFLFLFDRGYPSFFLLTHLSLVGVKFVMRCNTQFLSEINEAVKKRKKDQIVEIPFKKLKKHEKQILCAEFPCINILDSLKIRICLVKLKTGEIEILLTNLMNKKKYPHKIFLQLYSKRWGVETDIGFQKNRLEIENFSGESVLAVQQEFHSTILFKNATNLLIREAESELFKIESESESELIKDEMESGCEIEVKGEIINKKSSEYELIDGSKELECEIKSNSSEFIQKSIKLKQETPVTNLRQGSFNKLTVNCVSNFSIDHFNFPDTKQEIKSHTVIKVLEENEAVFNKAINRSIAFSRMKNRFIEALFASDEDLEIFCNDMKKLLKKNLERVIPGRKFVRKRKYPGKKFHKNNRRVV